MSDGLVNARWVAGYPVQIPGQGVVKPGQTVRIGAGEAAESDHWEPVVRKPSKEAE